MRKIGTSAGFFSDRFAANFGLLILFSSFCIGAFAYGNIVFSQGGGPYQTSDWLINYGGGFVRRGLFGSIYLSIFEGSKYILIGLFLLQFFLFLTVYCFFALFIIRSKSSWFLTVVTCSPSGIAFYGWDYYAFGRKEVIGFVILIFLGIRIAYKENNVVSWALLFFAFLFFLIGVFSWEPLALLIPAIIVLLLKGFKQSIFPICKYIVIILFVAVSIVGLLLSIIYKGTAGQAFLICESLTNSGLPSRNLCSGAIDAIGWSSSLTIEKVQDSFPLYFWYIPLFLLAIFPFLYSKLFFKFKTYTLTSFLMLFPLFLIVNDYGRWLAIFVVSFLIVFISTDKLKQQSTDFLSSPQFAIPYLTLWGVPHWADPNATFPIVGAIATPLRILSHFLLT